MKLLKLPSELPGGYLKLLSKFCSGLLGKHALPATEVKSRAALVLQMEKHISTTIPDCKLQCFGSTSTGLGLGNCDIDLCMTSKKLQSASVPAGMAISKICTALYKFPHMYTSLEPIRHAKVPLCKTLVLPSRLQVDISCYNVLGVHNSNMISKYAEIDKRFSVLSILIKGVAKKCSIANVREGSLSSYAYIMMVIYFLQRTSPPVLPCLQELWEKTDDQPEPPVNIEMSWNVYFFDDIENLSKVWDGQGKNKQSVGELWLEFLRFYSEFDFTKYAVTPRTSEMVEVSSLSHIGGRSKSLVIEDPFNLSHNLGRQMTASGLQFVLKIFDHTYTHFISPVSLPNEHLKLYLFDHAYLTGRSVPVNVPKFCYKCGAQDEHFVWECASTDPVLPNDVAQLMAELYLYATQKLRVAAPVYMFQWKMDNNVRLHRCQVVINGTSIVCPGQFKTLHEASKAAARYALQNLQSPKSQYAATLSTMTIQ
eukprot:scpid66678/ scgid28605/ Terminal uridylyltransferase 7; Zinc finger CCHC domain-containing protein 6